MYLFVEISRSPIYVNKKFLKTYPYVSIHDSWWWSTFFRPQDIKIDESEVENSRTTW